MSLIKGDGLAEMLIMRHREFNTEMGNRADRQTRPESGRLDRIGSQTGIWSPRIQEDRLRVLS